MKYFKKTAALLMAMVMMLAVGTTLFAYEITITNPQKKENSNQYASYTAYKIFSLIKGTEENPDKTYDYTLDSTSSAYDLLVKAYNKEEGLSLPNGVTLTPTTGTDGNGKLIYNTSVTFDNAAAFADWLVENKDNSWDGIVSSINEDQENGDTAAIDVGNDLGYYLILNDGANAVPNLTTVDDQIIIRDKSTTPTIEKTVDDNSVELGQTVTYTIKGQVPDTTDYTRYLYTVTDTMSQGLTFDEATANMKVVIVNESEENLVVVGTPESGEEQYDGSALPTLVYENNGFVLEFDMTRFQDYVGGEIVITYHAIVNDQAVAKVTSNKAILKYSNDPSDATKQDQTPSTEVAVYTSKIVVDKYKDGEKGTKLSNARFVLYRKNDDGTYQFYKYDSENDVVSWTAPQDNKDTVPIGQDAATVVTTDNEGSAEFTGLEDGSYYLLETAAPQNYNKLTEPVIIVVEHMIDRATQKEVGVHVISEVPNKNGALLPNTGGIGTVLLTALGVLVILGALHISPKKRKNS